MDYNDNELEENTVKLNISKKVEDEEIICEDCSAVCKSKKIYRDHKRRVHDSKRFICEVCSTEITGHLNFKNHVRKHDQRDCPKCSNGSKMYLMN